MPMTLVKPPDGVGEVGLGDDVVSLEHAAGLVPGHLHRDTLRHPGADQIPHCRPAQVVGNPAWTAGLQTGPLPGLRECPDLNAVAVENPRAQRATIPPEAVAFVG